MTTYPDDDCLLARGKYSTLGRERREQLERLQKIATTITTTASQLMRDCEKKEGPTNGGLLDTLQTCFGNLTKGRDRLIEICAEREGLRDIAWGNGKDDE